MADEKTESKIRVKSEAPKKIMTKKQEDARLKNLEKGRKIRLDSIKEKKEKKEYDLSSEDSGNDSDSVSDDAFVISKKKPKTNKKSSKIGKGSSSKNSDNLRNDVDELKDIVKELAFLQKKQNKSSRKPPKQSGTKIVVLPQNTPNSQTKSPNDNLMEALRKSLM